MTRLLLTATLAAIGAAVASPAAPATVPPTHRNICHLHHACPSDHHTYRWRGLLCTSYSDERTSRDKIRVRYGGRTYWCHR